MTALQPTIDHAASANVSGDLAQTTSAVNISEPAVSPKTWLAVAGATLGAFMAVLNIQIVNASLADIQGAIGAGIDDGGWISTSYLIAEIVVIPLSGWLAQVFSVRIYLLTNAVLFLAFSVACAFAQDLPQMIGLRALHGFSGCLLVRLPVHCPVVDEPHRRAGAVPVDRVDQQKAAVESAPIGPPQFRLWHPRQLPARHCALRFGVHPAGLPVAHPGL